MRPAMVTTPTEEFSSFFCNKSSAQTFGSTVHAVHAAHNAALPPCRNSSSEHFADDLLEDLGAYRRG